MKYDKGLFIFRRDLRIYDNTTLIKASDMCKEIICCFIFTPAQVTSENKYKSENAIQFMIETLNDLKHELKKHDCELQTFFGTNTEVLNSIFKQNKIDGCFFNIDYSPYALKRDEEVRTICNKYKVSCICEHDYYLYKPGSIKTGTGGFYKKYTPFYNTAIDKKVKPIDSQKITNFSKTLLKGMKSQEITLDLAFKRFTQMNENILVRGGRGFGLKRLSAALKEQNKYREKRDLLIYNTTFLSAHIKFGNISIREVFHSVKNRYGKQHGIISELIWREFFAHLLYNFPEVVGQSYNEKYRKIKWRKSMRDFTAWKMGQTGFPVVDAGMRQMNETGYMHNRCRMICATFLIKILLLDWRLGEQYFAEKLTDYDIASNNGNWQGISGTGVDMKPYFRTMNPWIQSKKFDPNCEYIKKWVPELSDIEPKDIHEWYDKWDKHKIYIKPIADYKERTEMMMELYKSV